jgi:hypothetical protein
MLYCPAQQMWYSLFLLLAGTNTPQAGWPWCSNVQLLRKRYEYFSNGTFSLSFVGDILHKVERSLITRIEEPVPGRDAQNDIKERQGYRERKYLHGTRCVYITFQNSSEHRILLLLFYIGVFVIIRENLCLSKVSWVNVHYVDSL